MAHMPIIRGNIIALRWYDKDNIELDNNCTLIQFLHFFGPRLANRFKTNYFTSYTEGPSLLSINGPFIQEKINILNLFKNAQIEIRFSDIEINDSNINISFRFVNQNIPTGFTVYKGYFVCSEKWYDMYNRNISFTSIRNQLELIMRELFNEFIVNHPYQPPVQQIQQIQQVQYMQQIQPVQQTQQIQPIKRKSTNPFSSFLKDIFGSSDNSNQPSPSANSKTNVPTTAINKDDKECCICLTNQKNMFINCGHICMCEECSRNVTTCPICRKNITTRTKVYI